MENSGPKSPATSAINGEGFLKGNAQLIALSIRFFDFTIVIVGAMIAHYIRFDYFQLAGYYKVALVTGLFACATLFPLFDLYKPWRGLNVVVELRAISLAWISVACILSIAVYLTKTGEDYSRGWFAYWVITVWILLATSRVVIRYSSRWARRRGLNTRNILIVGAGEFGQRVHRNLQNNEWVGIRTAGFIDDREAYQDEYIDGIPVVGNSSVLSTLTLPANSIESNALLKTLGCNSIDQVWIALPISDQEKIQEVTNLLYDSPISVVFVPDIFLNGLLNHSVDNFAGMPVVNLRSSPLDGISSTFKLVEDIVLSILAIAITALPMLVIAILIKLESKGPVIFKQKRYGIDGNEIVVWKFRTMNVMEDSNTVIQAKQGDSRVTKVGRFLRRTSLDELPQFFNVLQGRMSIVGPRPHAVAHNEKYRKIIDTYMWRCKVKPGITGWAQINGWRGETSNTEQMRKRVEFDLEYLQRWSLWFDIKIIFQTALKEFTNKNVY